MIKIFLLSFLIIFAMVVLSQPLWAKDKKPKIPSDKARIAQLEDQVAKLRVELTHVHQEDIVEIIDHFNAMVDFMQQLKVHMDSLEPHASPTNQPRDNKGRFAPCRPR